MAELIDLAKNYQEALGERDQLFVDYQAAQDKVRTLGSQMLAEVGKTEKGGIKPRVSVPASRSNGAHASDIRAWAKANKVDCPDRGRIPNRVIEAYQASHRS